MTRPVIPTLGTTWGAVQDAVGEMLVMQAAVVDVEGAVDVVVVVGVVVVVDVAAAVDVVGVEDVEASSSHLIPERLFIYFSSLCSSSIYGYGSFYVPHLNGTMNLPNIEIYSEIFGKHCYSCKDVYLPNVFVILNVCECILLNVFPLFFMFSLH